MHAHKEIYHCAYHKFADSRTCVIHKLRVYIRLCRLALQKEFCVLINTVWNHIYAIPDIDIYRSILDSVGRSWFRH